MGTSKGYGGPATGLVPSWIDALVSEPDQSTPSPPNSVPDPLSAPAAEADAQLAPAVTGVGAPLVALPTPSGRPAGSLQGARRSFTDFARTGSRKALARALSNYVRAGTGSSRSAASRMGSSRVVGSGLLGVVRDFQQIGIDATLKRLALGEMAGKPATEVFLAIHDVICPPGGTVDEAIARQAMLEAIGELAEAGIGNLDTLTRDQLEEFFLDFVSRSIEGRVMADLGNRGVRLPNDVLAVEAAERQLHDFVSGCTRDALSAHLGGLGPLSEREIQGAVDQIYELAFELVAAAGESG